MKKLLLLLLLLIINTPLFAQTQPHWTQIKGGPFVDIRRFGAVAGGVVDCSTAIESACASATALGGSVLIPQGSYFVGEDTNIALTANLVSYGELTGSGASTLVMQSDVSVTGGTYTNVRFEALEKSNIRISGVTITDTIGWGISYKGVEGGVVENCNISAITYESGLVAADGIFIGGCEDVRVIGNTVSDFRRIGITSDSLPDNTASASDNIFIIGNTVFNAHDSDDSTGEYNAAIWGENTNNITIENNNCYDIVGNPNQTRSIGLKVSNTYNPCVHRIVGNKINGVVLLGSSVGSDVDIVVKDNVFDAGSVGGAAIVIGYCKRVTLDNNLFVNQSGTTDINSTILVGVPSVATYTHGNIYISNNTFPQRSGNAATIMNLQGIPPERICIKNQPDVTIANAETAVNAGTTLAIQNCGVRLETASGTPARGFETLNISDCELLSTYMAGGKYTFIDKLKTSAGQLVLLIPANSDMHISNSVFTGGVVHYGGATSSLTIHDSLFTGSTNNDSGGSGCIVTNAESTGASNDMLKIQDCTFITAPSGADPAYAVSKNGSAPAHVYLDGNYFDTASGDFTNLVGTATNNVAFDQFP